ncbi:hypothetical protein K7W42_15395 [Deinococcus sp. HMF7604]|uniref:Kelch repeat-containing protein n=1 Tax=Deinococcus betulae TaxID=2873312 RepID=UPI001CCBE8F6|nr:kelch repeat-containing protein [Deinococcus betulae]MBZ9752238.1 hypothetical protein [Deinococcus betulae]
MTNTARVALAALLLSTGALALTTPGRLHRAGSLSVPRAAQTATTLLDGQVLIVGGCTRPSCELDAQSATAELFDPRTGQLRPTGSLASPRVSQTATRLADGQVLIAGGWTVGRVVDTAERYDPQTGRFTLNTPMRERRSAHTATLLADGRVLITGGTVREGRALYSAEVYTPQTGQFVPVGSLTQARAAHVAVRLMDGRVLIAGGHADRSGALDTLELFDPKTNTFHAAGRMITPRNKLAGTLLPSGQVLLLGGTRGYDRDKVLTSAEVFDPARKATRVTASMTRPRYKFTDAVVRLADGRILVAGAGGADVYTEQRQGVGLGRFDAVMGTMPGNDQFVTVSRLPDGGALIAGGYDAGIQPTAALWRFQPDVARQAP